MKKIILSMFCIFLLVGCSTKQENITIKKNNNQETVDLKVGFGLHHIEDGNNLHITDHSRNRSGSWSSNYHPSLNNTDS